MIVCCGENLVDLVPIPGLERFPYGGFRAAPGGSPYNSAIAGARLGSGVFYLGKISDDFLGDKLFGRLAENGVRTDLVVRCGLPATLAFFEKGPDGENRYAFYSSGSADSSLTPEDIPASLPRGSHFLLAGSISMLQEPSASTIRGLIQRESGNLLVSFDPNVRPSLIPDRDAFREMFEDVCGCCGILKASDSDLRWIYGSSDFDKAATRLLDLGVSVVFITHGEKGSVARTRKAKARVDAVPVAVADTIGAGDTYHAAILASLDESGMITRDSLERLDRGDLVRLLRFASSAAALNCTREGADPPTLAEIEKEYPALRRTRGTPPVRGGRAPDRGTGPG